MNAKQLLNDLLQQGFHLWTDQGELHYRGWKKTLSPEWRQQLAQSKAELMKLLGEKRKYAALSAEQQALWFLDQFAPGNPFYNMSMALRLTGTLDLAALQWSLNEIVRRHEILRAAFHTIDDQAVQLIVPPFSLPMNVVDLQHLAGADQEAEIGQQIAQAEQQPFHLGQPPLLRVTVLKLSHNEHILLLTIHHIIFDGWSNARLIQELTALYTAYVTGQPSPLPTLAIQYIDYAGWQRQPAQSALLNQELAYWRQQLQGNLPVLELPTDYPRPAVQRFAGRARAVTLSKPLTEKLKSLSQEAGATLYMTLLAAFQTLLYRYSGQEDILVGSPFANRSRVEFEPLIGFFVNALVMRTDLSGKPSFRTLLQRVRTVALEAFAHPNVPFERVIAELKPERDSSRHPLFQTVFALQQAPLEAVQLPDLMLHQRDEFSVGTTRVDLELHLWEAPDGLSGVLTYCVDLFDEATITRFLGHFQTLLAGIVADPNQSIATLPLLTPPEYHQLVHEWNHTKFSLDGAQCFHRLFEAQVRQTPDAIALLFEGQAVSYQQLNQRANQLAHHLQALGVQPEMAVAVCTERSPDLIIAMLAILKAGGVYVPLNASYPSQRLAFMLADTQPSLLLTQQPLLTRLPEFHGTVLCLDRDWSHMAAASTENLDTDVTLAQLAYIIYTSGSTGQPKGVLIEQRGLWNVSQAQVEAYGLGVGDRVLQFFSASFDASIFEIVAALRSGATLCLACEEQLLPGPPLVQFMRETGITFTTLTPSVLELLPPEQLPALAIVASGGEACPPELVSRWLAQKGRRFFNNYGPTETTIWTMAYPCVEDGQKPPIGRPVLNTEIYLLTPDLQPTPIGVVGELHIGGLSVARGYLNQPDLTRAKFIPDPFADRRLAQWQAVGAPLQPLLYKTGDLARYLPDGNVAYVGRVDHQLKVRGFRVEPAEIEAVLHQHPAVREAVVVARTDNAQDKRLVAYITQKDDGQAADGSTSELMSEHTRLWEAVVDEIHTQAGLPQDATQNFAGWRSSHTQAPLPLADMKEWVEDTVNRIMSLKPRRVLEIGCGTGLLLLPIAPHCEAYCGLDISQVALDQLQTVIDRQAPALSHVQLFRAAADQLHVVNQQKFDTVILNSVVQYFPNQAYLRQVLQSILALLADEAAIFIGDVRCLPLLETFHTSVQLHQAPVTLSTTQLQRFIREQMARENELVIDPTFFAALPGQFPQIRQVQTQLKRGRSRNEITQFRYDVTLSVTKDEPRQPLPTAAGAVIDWQAEELSPVRLRRWLQIKNPDVLHITNVPNARVSTACQAVQLSQNGAATVGEVRQQLAQFEQKGVEPEDLWALEQDLPYRVIIQWAASGCADAYDLLLVKRTFATNGWLPAPPVVPQNAAWPLYTNNPLRMTVTRNLLPALRRFVAERLPDYMVPSVFVPLEGLPLTTNGKVDYRALPAPDSVRLDIDQEYNAPRTALEQMLAQLWAEFLGWEQIGIHDNFFELGGNSLLATQIIAKMQAAFQVELPLRKLFETPTIAGIAAEITLRQTKNTWGATFQEAVNHLPQVTPAPDQRYEPFPLTSLQQAYWAGRMGDFALGNIASHGYLEFERVGLDLQRFNQAWQRLIDRHEMLRAIVRTDGTQQLLATTPSYQIEVLDLRGQEPAQVEQALLAIRTRMSHQVHALDKWPLFELRASLLDGNRTLLHISLDGLIIDGWSLQLMDRELSTLYATPDAPLPALTLSFRDYVVTEKQLKQTEQYQRAEQYWLARLDNFPPAPKLPLARDPHSLTAMRFRRWEKRLAADRWQQLRQHAQRINVTPAGLLLAAFAELLTVWGEHPRFTINLTFFNRLPLHPQVNDIFGDFTSLLLLTVDNSQAGHFTQRAIALQQQLWEDLNHSLYNGLDVLRALRRRHSDIEDVAMPIVFTSMLTQGQVSQNSLGFAKPEEIIYSIAQTPQVWLDYKVFEQNGALVLQWDVVEELFPDQLIDDMMNALYDFLVRLSQEEALWEAPYQTLTPAAQLASIAQINATSAPIPPGLLQTQFLEQVRQCPTAPAIITAERTLSYQEVERRANFIARWLRESGAQPNQLVAIVTEKGWEEIVAVLAILQAGAAYLPVSAELPQERRWHLLAHARATLVLTQSWLDEALAWPDGTKRLCIDIAPLDQPETPALVPVQQPEDLAYVIYTSGSTGLPKGVMIDHRGALNTIVDLNQRFQVQAADRVLALSALGFDLSVYDIFGLLAVGGAIVMPQASLRREPAHWTTLIEQNSVTLWNTVPALLELLVDYWEIRQQCQLASLRLVFMSGDWIPVTLPARARAFLPDAQLISMGGATEASIWSIIYPIEQVELTWKSIPYGKPMVNQQFYVLSTDMTLCPTWVPGELYIGGIGLAKGYWADEEKTQARFISHPFTGERLYRTGDLGRYLPDGNIEFLGRQDFQVKVQGHRIELGEIEMALAQHPAVRTALVTVVDASGHVILSAQAGEKRLAAYVVPRQFNPNDASTLVSELRAFLQRKLPYYMVPSAYRLLETLPLTPNGKIDRKALPPLTQETPLLKSAAIVQQADWHEQISALVAAVLKLQAIEPQANLLELGANSVDMIRIMNALEQSLGFRPSIGDFYQMPTIAYLSELYQQQTIEQRSAGSVKSTVAVLLDPAQREAFKARQLHLRQFADPKTYPVVDLPLTPEFDAALLAQYKQRRSQRRFSHTLIGLARFSEFLGLLRQIPFDDQSRRLYPSAGGLYPVQTYLYVKPDRIEGLDEGVYYYQPQAHRLVALAPHQRLDRTVYEPLVNRPIFDEAAFALFLIAELQAIIPMYGELSHDFCMLEAGYMGQQLLRTAPEYALGLCPIGALEFAKIEHLFALQESQCLLHSFLGGALVESAVDGRTAVSDYQLSGAQHEAGEREEGEL